MYYDHIYYVSCRMERSIRYYMILKRKPQQHQKKKLRGWVILIEFFEIQIYQRNVFYLLPSFEICLSISGIRLSEGLLNNFLLLYFIASSGGSISKWFGSFGYIIYWQIFISLYDNIHGGPKQSLWINLEENCLRNSKMFFDGVFLLLQRRYLITNTKKYSFYFMLLSQSVLKS